MSSFSHKIDEWMKEAELGRVGGDDCEAGSQTVAGADGAQ